MFISESTETESKQSEILDGTADVGVVVQHQAVEVVKSIEQLKDAKDQFKQAEEDYRQYQKDLRVLSDRRDQLVADYNAEIPGIGYEDILVLEQLIDELEGDKDWYQAGVVLASANLVSKTTLLTQQTAAAANSSGTYGFNAGLQLKIDATQTRSELTSSTARGSLLAGNNITIQTGNNEEPTLSQTQTQITGSDLQASGDINIDTGDLTVEASRNSQQSQSNTEHVDATIAQTVYGAAGGPTINVNLSRGENRENSSTVNNSTLTARNINLSSEGNTTIDGANIAASDTLNLDVGDDLIIASQQNTASRNSHNAGISGGFGLGSDASAEQNGKTTEGAIDNIGQSNGEVSSISAGLNAGTGRTTVRQTELTTLTGNSVNINVGDKTTIAGAAIAAVNEDGSDNGNLNIETQSLEVVHLNDSSYSKQLNQGINSGVGIGPGNNTADPNVNVNTSTLQYSNSSTITESKTLATIGQGTITVRDDQEAGTDSTTDLNRDKDNTTLKLYNVDRQQGNVDLTVDTRLLTEEGRAQIKQDFVDNYEFGEDIYRAAEQLSDSDQLGLLNFWTALHNNTQATQLKNELLRNPENNGIIEGLKSGDGDQ